MNYLVLDIETVPNEHINEYLSKKVYEPDSRLKDPEKIEQSLLNKKQKDFERAGLYWWTGKIICISTDDGRFKKTFIGDDEVELLVDFFDYLETKQPHVNLIGKNSKDFDFPFIVGRALANNTGLPDHFRNGSAISDIDHIFSFSTSCQQRSTLADYAFGLRLEKGKLAHGSDVKGMYDEKKWKEIGEYCEQDVAIVREMLNRYYTIFKKPDLLNIPF